MTDPVYRGEAAMLDWGETRSSGAYVKLQLHPDDMGEVHPFKGIEKGERFVVVIAPFQDEPEAAQDATATGEPSPHPEHDAPVGAPTGQHMARRRWHELSRAQQSGIRCNEPDFRAFLRNKGHFLRATPESAADVVRKHCGVDSRARLDTNEKAGKIWDKLDADYLVWSGQAPEARG